MDSYLITGVAGFIASHLARYLVNKYPKSNIIGIDKMTYCSSLTSLKDIIGKPNFHFEEADILDAANLGGIITTYKITHIFHLAAFTHVDLSFTDPLTFTINNVLGTHTLLEVIRKHPIKKFVHMSTDEVYGTSSSVSDETSMLNPTNPYSASKAGAEHIVQAYRYSFKLPVVIVRSNNVYGTHQYPEKVLPLFTTLLTSDKKCTIHGSGLQTRSFIHVKDVCRVLNLMMIKGEVGQIYNISSTDELSVISLFQKICKIVKPKDNWEDWLEYGKDRPFNDQHYRIKATKLEELGYKPKYTIDKDLEEVVRWYQEKGI